MSWKVSILEYIEDHPACTLPEAAEALDAPLGAAAAALFELKAEGVVREGAPRRGHPALSVHYIPEPDPVVPFVSTAAPLPLPQSMLAAEVPYGDHAPYVAPELFACLGGCGAMVGPGQKCPACAAIAVDDWRHTRDAAAREAERRARPALHWKQAAPKTRPRKAAKRGS